MSAKVVFAMYRPSGGKDSELRALIKQHYPALKRLGLVTDRSQLLLKAKDGSYIEIFEWVSDEAARRAHEHPEVAEIWEQMGVVGTFGKLRQLLEVETEFPHFDAVDL